jgi:hypothetical protein
MKRKPELGTERKMRGRWYVCIDPSEVAEGDYAELVSQRLRIVAAVQQHRTGEVTLSLEAMTLGKYTIDRARRVSLRAVVAIWRKRAVEKES